MNQRIRAWVRRWLGLEGEAKDIDIRLDALERHVRQAVPVLNDHTTSLQRFVVYEQHVPSIRRVHAAMREKAIREKRKQEAAAALAAPPAPPQDALLDEVSAEVGGG